MAYGWYMVNLTTWMNLGLLRLVCGLLYLFDPVNNIIAE